MSFFWLILKSDFNMECLLKVIYCEPVLKHLYRQTVHSSDTLCFGIWFLVFQFAFLLQVGRFSRSVVSDCCDPMVHSTPILWLGFRVWTLENNTMAMYFRHCTEHSEILLNKYLFHFLKMNSYPLKSDF